MYSKGKKELEESSEFDEFYLWQLNVVVLQISPSDIRETVLIKRRYIYVF